MAEEAGPPAQPPIIRSVAISVLSGLLTGLCLPKPGLCFLAWFSLAPFLKGAATAPSGKISFCAGLAAGASYHALVLHWIYLTCRFASVPIPVALLAWGALSVFLGLNWAVFAVFGRWLAAGFPRPVRPFIWAAAWTALAAACAWWTPRVGGDLLAHTQYRHLSFLQISSLAGPHLLGFLIVAWNACVAEIWEEEGRRGMAPATAAAAAALAACWIYGRVELRERHGPFAGKRINVEILQPAIDQYRKWDESAETEILKGFDELLSGARTARPDLIVWPESAWPRIVPEGAEMPLARDWGRKLGAAQLVGAVTEDSAGTRNSAILLGAEGAQTGIYHKRELVPFGEYVPFAFLRSYIGILNVLGGIDAGEPEQPLLLTPLGPTAASICYEAVFPRWARRDAGRGARAIVNITNDGWYKDTWGPHQHFSANVYRAVENRVTVVRSGNTGVSAVIDPWGVVTASLALEGRGRLDAAVEMHDRFLGGSFHGRHGDWFGALCLGLTAALAALRRVRA